ncbi:MAG TPA: hypothetical protein VMF91_27510 [Bryobacteraceae bacterium]|nr:hypothetical protein [Bryobacteraceae bacterium]
MDAIQFLATSLAALWSETDGQDLVEYSLLLGFIAISTISILTGVKSSMNTLWSKISSALSSAAAAS